MKTCSSCGKILPYSEFHIDQKSADGYSGRCKLCKSEYRKAYHKRNPKTGTEWDKRNPERAKNRINRFRKRNEDES